MRTVLLIIGAVVLVFTLAIVAIVGLVVVRYQRLTPAVNSLELAHNFKDNKPVDVTTMFKSTDPDLYAVIRLNTNKGNPTIKVVWTVVDAVDPTTKRPVTGQTFGQVEKAASSRLLYASVSRDSTPWPVGKYKADVYLDGALVKTAEFTIAA